MSVETELAMRAGPDDANPDDGKPDGHCFRFHSPHRHLGAVFGDDWFAQKAEAFARFFGTPVFLMGQTVFVTIWIILNVVGWTTFDLYPFILLNLAFSLQAAYAAPLILLAQTRQADRDKAMSIADASSSDAMPTTMKRFLGKAGPSAASAIALKRSSA